MLLLSWLIKTVSKYFFRNFQLLPFQKLSLTKIIKVNHNIDIVLAEIVLWKIIIIHLALCPAVKLVLGDKHGS